MEGKTHGKFQDSLIKKRLKTYCTILQLALTYTRVRLFFASHFGQSGTVNTLFAPLFTDFIYIDCKYCGVMILF